MDYVTKAARNICMLVEYENYSSDGDRIEIRGNMKNGVYRLN